MSSGGVAPMAARVRPAAGHDCPAVIALLEAASLPTAGVPPTLERFLVAEEHGRVIGVVGLELYEDGALLRSAAVQPGGRGTGIGAALVRGILAAARESGVTDVYLLTTTAERWFPRFGFERIARADVPAGVGSSLELREACPASAAVMRLRLSGTAAGGSTR
jgi:amino-acid N-acetyltransferase